MTTSRPMRGMAVLATGALLWGLSAGPASADSIRDSQWPLQKYAAMADVWPISQGENVIVAVIDSGVTADHPDLAGAVLPGADFTADGGDGHKDVDGHGTSMAALIAGHGHGSGGKDGVSGLAPKAKILPLRVDLTHGTDISSKGSEGEINKAIRYAVDHGAKVINLSVAGAEQAGEREAVNYALSKDVVLVGGTGNDGSHGTPVQYPAAFPGVVAVAAVDKQGMLWEDSDRGPEVTLAAPGVDIATIKIGSASAYHTTNGTSDATAYVSAIAALVRSKYPNLSAGQVINRMIKSAVAPPDKSKPLPNDSYGYGIASPREALKPNPAVDNGPKENPLLARAESHGDGGGTSASPAASQPGSGDAANGGGLADTGKSDDGTPVYVFVLVGVVALVVIVGVIVLVRRSRGNGSGGPGGNGGGGGGGGFVPPGPPPYGPGAQQFPPQQQPPYAGQVPQPQGSVYGAPQGYPQPPAGTGGGNPYR
ncbi:type VII secretion-associated serine protease mycosin [Kitasatospora sp. NPDC059571]|uniref:type VII secretion-associated serine protease mycosin n=1 Tax=Kitasatospora sp. NPDC059571 TaxID=3346871 RepID=UPI0036A2865C